MNNSQPDYGDSGMEENIRPLPRPMVQHQYLRLAAGELHFAEAGNGRPLVLLHGGHGSWVHWIANIDALAQHCRVLVLDMPGFGGSYDPGQPPTLDEYRLVVDELLASLALENVALVGFSFGSIVATAVALANPDRVSSLSIVNPPGTGARTAQAAALPGELSTIARAYGLQAGITASLQRLMLSDADLVTPELVKLISGCVTETRHVTRDLSRNAGIVDLLQNITQKTQILIGAKDPYQRHIIVNHGEELRRRLPRADIRIVPGAAHWLQYEQAEAFNRLLLEFIGH
ncbi:alpha/beta fold hydrolase [Herbaspirillum lusitanum]|uniref:Alpha/beta fold hydrolase n=1 Tax=Herbaspirillum lusitanum TaxID=213312 RepID=A0ABW9ABR6_9BURK